jgi:hypothetical protein
MKMFHLRKPKSLWDRMEQRVLLYLPIVLFVGFVYYSMKNNTVGASYCSVLVAVMVLIGMYDRQKHRKESREITAALIELTAREMCANRGLNPDEMVQGNLSMFGPNSFHGSYSGIDRAMTSPRWRLFYYPAFDMLAAASILTD